MVVTEATVEITVEADKTALTNHSSKRHHKTINYKAISMNSKPQSANEEKMEAQEATVQPA